MPSIHATIFTIRKAPCKVVPVHVFKTLSFVPQPLIANTLKDHGSQITFVFIGQKGTCQTDELVLEG